METRYSLPDYSETLLLAFTRGGPAFEGLRAAATHRALRPIAGEIDRYSALAADAIDRSAQHVETAQRNLVRSNAAEHFGRATGAEPAGNAIADFDAYSSAANASKYAFRTVLVSLAGQACAEAFYEALKDGPEYFGPAE